MGDSEQSSVPSNEGSDAEASEDDQQPTVAYGWGREPRYSAEELPSRVTNVEEEDASASSSLATRISIRLGLRLVRAWTKVYSHAQPAGMILLVGCCRRCRQDGPRFLA